MKVQILIIILFSLLSFYTAGSLLIRLLKIKSAKDKFYSTFRKLMIGFMLIISLYAIYKTSANTILWGFGIIGLFAYFLSRTQKHKYYSKPTYWLGTIKSELIPLLVLFGFAIALFLLFGGLFYSEPFNNIPHGDYYFYCRLINVMDVFGTESATFVITPFFSASVGATPYHYPELWFATLITSVFNILPLESIVIVVQVSLASMLCLGIISLARTINKSFLIYCLAIISLFFSGILIINILPQAESFIDFGTIFTPKYSIIGLFFIWFSILSIKKDVLFFFPLLILPILNIALAPATFVSITVFFLIKSIKAKSIKPYFKQLFIVFGIAIFIALFYLLQPPSPSGMLGLKEILQAHSHSPFYAVKIMGGAVAILISLYFYYFIPIIFTTIFNKDKSVIALLSPYKDILFYFLISLFVSVFIWGISYPMHDSIQFHYLPTYLLLNIIVFISIAVALSALRDSHILKKISFWLIIVFIIFINVYQFKNKAFLQFGSLENRYSSEYIIKLNNELEKLESPRIGACIKPPVHVKTSFDANPYWNTSPQMDNFISDFNLININPFDYDLSNCDLITKKRATKNLKNAPFTKFVQEWNKTNKNTSIDSLQFYYINEYKIKFIILYAGTVLPEIFEEHIKSKIIDKQSGEITVFLN